MPYDEAMVERIRDLLVGEAGLVEKKMFGGVGFLIGGNMACGASNKGGLIVRAAKADWERWRHEPGADAMHRGQTAMTGWLVVAPEAVESDAAFATWVGRGRDYARSLPPK